MQEKQESEKFSFHVSISTDIDEEDGSILLNVWFEGNTKPHKDDIKSIGGYRWRDRQSASDFFSEKMSPLCWTKTIKHSELEKEVAMASKIGANTKKLLDDSDFFETSNYQIAVERQKNGRKRKIRQKALKNPKFRIFQRDIVGITIYTAEKEIIPYILIMKRFLFLIKKLKKSKITLSKMKNIKRGLKRLKKCTNYKSYELQ